MSTYFSELNCYEVYRFRETFLILFYSNRIAIKQTRVRFSHTRRNRLSLGRAPDIDPPDQYAAPPAGEVGGDGLSAAKPETS